MDDPTRVDDLLAQIKARRNASKTPEQIAEMDRLNAEEEQKRKQAQEEQENRVEILKSADWSNDVDWKMRKLFCLHYGIENYTIQEDGTVNVDGDVYMSGGLLFDKLPFKFGEVTGSFDMRYFENISTLNNCPTVVGRNFYISAVGAGPFSKGYGGYSDDEIKQALDEERKELLATWKLDSLNGGPERVGGTYTIHKCPNLKSLNGAPSFIGGQLDIMGCENLPIFAALKIAGMTNHPMFNAPMLYLDNSFVQDAFAKCYKQDGTGDTPMSEKTFHEAGFGHLI
jgi:hypothetical protein